MAWGFRSLALRASGPMLLLWSMHTWGCFMSPCWQFCRGGRAARMQAVCMHLAKQDSVAENLASVCPSNA